MRARLPQCGLYAITDPERLPRERLYQGVEAAIAGGAVMVQYRDKPAAAQTHRERARRLQDICGRHNVPLIINDDVAVAAEIGADGVHLGADDAGLQTARAQLGSDTIIGISCYGSLDRAQAAAAEGADYVAFGSFYPSPTKPTAARAPIELLSQARDKLDIPVVAIGGVNADNGGALVAAGADLLAVISGLFAGADIEAQARELATLWQA